MNNVFLNLKKSRGVLTFIATIALLGTSVAIADIVSGDSSTGKSNQITVTRLTLNKPASVVEGDLLLANITVEQGSGVAVAAPLGWTEILRTGNANRVSIISYWKIAGASEPSNYTWSFDLKTTAVGGITRYSCVDATNPIDSAAGSSGNGTVAIAPAITTSTANDKVVAIFSVDAGRGGDAGKYFATPADMTERYDVSNTSSGPSTALDDATQAAVGNSGTKSSTIANGRTRHNWVAQQIALRAPLPRSEER